MVAMPDKNGHFGIFGGSYVPETLVYAMQELTEMYEKMKDNDEFKQEMAYYREHYLGRPTPLFLARNFSERIGKGNRVYLKREDLNHTGAHKMNNTLGQALLCKRIGKKRVIAETGAGMHGVATATAAALLNLECEIFMGEVDIERQSQNVNRMKMLGAKVTPVLSGSRTLKDAVNEAFRNWISTVTSTHYVMGTVAGAHPFPYMVRDFQRIIGDEAKLQILKEEGRLPDVLVACVGGGSNAMGLFYPFVEDRDVELVGVEAGGEGLDTDKHAATLQEGTVGVIHGSMTYMLQDEDGQILEAHSVSAGLDYPGVGPEHSYLKDISRAKYSSATDRQAVEAFLALSRDEGIIPALESSHALAYLMNNDIGRDRIVVVNLSGRGDKDMDIINRYLKKVDVTL